MSKSVAHERRIVFYPNPAYLKLIQKHVEQTGETKSNVARQALKEFFDRRNGRG